MQRDYEKGEFVVPNYRVIRRLGSGGFGTVYQAGGPFGTEVAIKVIGLERTAGLKELRSLDLIKLIRHPNLVPIIGAWLKDADGTLLDDSAVANVADGAAVTLPYGAPRPKPAELVIAMGLGDMNLLDRLHEVEQQQSRQGIPPEDLLDYFQQTARAIDFLNREKQILHCDIKPQNILLVGGGVQVCDYGLARRKDDMRVTSVSLSIAYAAPEQLPPCRTPGLFTDQYALAISYVELRTGRLPFHLDADYKEIEEVKRRGQLDSVVLARA